MKLSLLGAGVMLCAASQAVAAAPTTKYSAWMADSFLLKNSSLPTSGAYQYAVLYHAFDLVSKATKNSSYYDFVEAQLAPVIQENGSIPMLRGDIVHSLDYMHMGRVLLDHYASNKNPKFKLAADYFHNQYATQPRSPDGGFWHNDHWPGNLWCDQLWWGDVFYAKYTSMFQPFNVTAWDDVLLQIELLDTHARNTTTKLVYHGYDYYKKTVWANPVTGASPNVWSRADGWYFMTLLEVLDVFPYWHPGYFKLLKWYVMLAEGLLKAQDPSTGGWWLVMNEPYPSDPRNYIESSGSAMFTFGLLKGLRKGYIRGDKYKKAAFKAYDCLTTRFVNVTGDSLNWEGTDPQGDLSGNGTFEYYIANPVKQNDVKGAGSFMFAAVEYEEMRF